MGFIVEHFNSIGIDALKSAHFKKYVHFDFPLSEAEKSNLIDQIAKNGTLHHRYLPFISFRIIFKKFSRTAKTDPKSRLITLPSHHDALVYKYYGAILNHYYSIYAQSHGIDNVAVAYRERNDKKKVSNITAAKEVFDYICTVENALIIKGDFHNFFDSLEHKFLIREVKEVLGPNLTKDWHRMLLSITRFQSITKKKLMRQLNNNGLKIAKNSKRGKAYVKNLKQLGTLIKGGKIRLSSTNTSGIPQGTAVSAVLANIYMISFDEWLSNEVTKMSGIYRRYSDDFIIVLPASKVSNDSINSLIKQMRHYYGSILKLDISEKKTHLYKYCCNRKIVLKKKCDKWNISSIDYLGFTFDGKSVSMKPASIYKFRYRSKRAINGYSKLINSKIKTLNSLEAVVYQYKVKKFVSKTGNMKQWRYPNRLEKKRFARYLLKVRSMTEGQIGYVHKHMAIHYLSMKPLVVHPSRNTKVWRIGSMLNYAKTAQGIFTKNRTDYNVVILKQVIHQIKRNQLNLHSRERKIMPPGI